MDKYRILPKILCVSLGVLVMFIAIWCGGNKESSGIWLSIGLSWFTLEYNGNVKLTKVPLKTDDLDEIVDLYQEVWNVWYRDSLLIAEKYSNWLWVNAFSQDNLDTLKNQWLTLSDIKKTQIWLEKSWEKINAVLVEYKIVGWLVEEIPMLYISQLFIPNGRNIMLLSFITENKSSRSNVSNMFKNIK